MKVIVVLAVAAATAFAFAPAAGASGEIVDPCGPGAPPTDRHGELEPRLGWMDVCGADVGGFGTSGSLRGVTTTIHLAADVDSRSGTGVQYYAGFRTRHCTIRQFVGLYQGSAPKVRPVLHADCDFRVAACPHPLSEVSNFECGQSTRFELEDPAALTTSVSGDAVRIAFDPTQLPSGTIPSGLASDLAAGTGAELDAAWAQTLFYAGVQGVMTNAFGPGGDWASTDASIGLE